MAFARGMLLAGDLFINRQQGGVYQGWKGPIECDKFEIKANSELKERSSKGRASYGQTVASASLPKPFDLNITLGETNADGLAIALLGTVSVLSQASGTLTDELVDLVHDTWVPLSKANLTGTPTLTNNAASTTWVEGTDYIVDKQAGLVKALSTGTIPNNTADAKFDCAYGALTGTEMKGATQSAVRAKFRLVGTNQADGTPVDIIVHDVTVSSDAAIDFMATDFASVPLPCRMNTPVGFTEPFTIKNYIPS